MIRALIFIGLSLAFASPAHAQDASPPLPLQEVPAAPQAPDPLVEIEAYFNSLSGLSGEFIQHGPDGSISDGTIYLERPGRVRFDYGEETPLLIVSDGKILTFVDYDVGQVTRWPIKDTPLAPLLLDDLNVREQFDVVSAGPGALPNRIIIQARDAEKPEQGEITLFFETFPDQSEISGRLRFLGWTVRDAQGLLTTVTLNRVRYNPTLSAQLWEFDDPRATSSRRRRR